MTMTKLVAKAKRAWKSWTINYGLLLTILGAVQANAQDVIPPQYMGQTMMIIGVLVAVLRFKTNAPLESK